MKKELCAALLATLLTLSACAPAAPAEDSPAPAQPVQTEPAVQPEPEPPAPAMPEAALAADAFLDEPQTVQADLDEVVSYSLRLPHVTLENDAASEAVNAGFDTLCNSLIRYAEETVYPEAQQQQAIGFLTGDYTISAVDGVLTVVYTVSESYGTRENAVSRETSYSFDMATGALLNN